MYIIIKKFRTSAIETLIEMARTSFLPAVSKMPGFIDYHVIRVSDDTISSVLLFRSKTEGDASSVMSQKWFIDNKLDSVCQLQELIAGEVVVRG